MSIRFPYRLFPDKSFTILTCLDIYFRFYYYTAGTGGAGPTILATSFLLLGEDVIAYNKGQLFRWTGFSPHPDPLVFIVISSLN